ncbi:MAG TPA: site-2 protease family protein [Ktedonobacteraceae bacterium]
MSRRQDDFAEYSLVEYSQPSYADPHFYDPRPEDPAAPHQVFVEPPAIEETAPARQGEGLSDEYHSPYALEHYTTDVGEEQRAAGERGTVDGPGAERNKKRKRLAGLGGLGATLIGLLVKFKTLLVILFDIKWVAFLGKFGLASLSALASVVIYAQLFGWGFGVGLVLLLFIHEMGHALVMKLKGIPVGGMIFIPLLGAAVFMRRMPNNARDEAEVGIAGPVAGALASLACLLIAHAQFDATGLPGIWAPLAYFGCFMNLFNLIPIVPFDGGRVLAAIDRRIWLLGFLVLVAIQIWEWMTGSSSIWLMIFILIAATDFWTRRRMGKSAQGQAYYAVPVGERIVIGLAYFALAAALVMGMTLAHSMMVFN